MSLLSELAVALARDAFELSERTGDTTLVEDIATTLESSSSTLQEEFLTAIRYLRADSRARRLLEQRRKTPVTAGPQG